MNIRTNFRQTLYQTGNALDLGRDDDLRRAAVGGGGEGLKALELDDGVGRHGLIDEPDALGGRALHGQDGLGAALRLEDLLLLFRVGAQHGGLLLALSHQDGGALLALGTQDGLTAFTFGLHLLFHRVLDLLRRENVLELHAVDLDAPRVGGFVEDLAHLGVDDVAAGQALVELEIADEVTQRRCREVLDREDRLLDAVGVELRVGDLVVDDGVDLHGDVVLRDDGLRREVRDLLLERQTLGDRLNERDLQVQADAPRGLVCAEAGDDISLRLRHDADVAHEDDERDHDDSVNDELHGSSSLFICVCTHADGGDDELDAFDAQHGGGRSGGNGSIVLCARRPDLSADGHGAVTGQIVNVLGDEAFLPDEHIGVGRLRAAVDIFFHQRPRHGKGRDRDDEKPHELQPQRRVEHGGNERGERTHGKPDRDETGGQPLNDQKDYDQADPDGRHGEGDPGNDHRQNLLCKRWEYAVRQCFAMEISYRIYGLKARKTPANRRMKFPDSFPLYFLKQLE